MPRFVGLVFASSNNMLNFFSLGLVLLSLTSHASVTCRQSTESRLISYRDNATTLEESPWIRLSESEIESRFDRPFELNRKGLFLIGFEQGSDGKIQALTAKSPQFKSHRHLNQSGWFSDRKAEVVPLTFVPIAGMQKLTYEAALLPDTIKFYLRQHHFLRTTHTTGPTEFSLLMYSSDTNRGRTGILLQNGRPVILKNKQTNTEMLVELKGAGMPTGGIKDDSIYGYRGGLQERDAQNEFIAIEKNIEIATQKEAVRTLGYVVDRQIQQANNSENTAVLIRLVPSSVRATFFKPEVFDENFSGRYYGMGLAWGRLIKSGYLPLSHAENLVKGQNGQWLNTDFADIFHISQFPLRDSSGTRGIESLKETLNSRYELEPLTIQNKKWIDDQFFAGLAKALETNPQSFSTTQEAYDFILRSIFSPYLYDLKYQHRSLSLDKSFHTRVTLLKKQVTDYYENALFRQSWFDREDRTTGIALAVEENLKYGSLKLNEDRKVIADVTDFFNQTQNHPDRLVQRLQYLYEQIPFLTKDQYLLRSIFEAPLRRVLEVVILEIKAEHSTLKILLTNPKLDSRDKIQIRYQKLTDFLAFFEKHGYLGLHLKFLRKQTLDDYWR